ncbi:hypothetical protein AB0O34_34960 [Sphaerisporangium sp. NPDC088356]|uniref:hypothetical protein n=1 Tax=Sphaerisporangium sp. NPDC088356 TaxID=3154871 RepID=UPI003428FB2A
MVAATGRPIILGACGVSIVVDGLIASHRVYYDQLELATQLGANLCFGAVNCDLGPDGEWTNRPSTT